MDLFEHENFDTSLRRDFISANSTLQKDFQLSAYSETFYPEEQARMGKYKNAKNKIAFRYANKNKSIFQLKSDIVEIYDLENDPNEKINLYIMGKK